MLRLQMIELSDQLIEIRRIRNANRNCVPCNDLSAAVARLSSDRANSD